MTFESHVTHSIAANGGIPTRPTRKRANPVIDQQTRRDVMDILESGALAQFYGGTHVRSFESEYAAWFGRKEAVATNSGTSALHLMFLAAKLPRYSEVLVPANAYVSAASALIQAELVPVIVDIDPYSWAMDLEDIERQITPRTSAILAVHMYGQPCPMEKIREISRLKGLVLLEDCGQSHGAVSDGQVTGTFGLAAAYSLCCRKHVAMGEGGIIITDDGNLADRARSLAHKGKGPNWFDYWELGFSYNMTEIQAAIGRHQLARLSEELSTRSALAEQLRSALGDVGLEFPVIRSGSTHGYFKQNALVPTELASSRDAIVEAIRAENVGCDPTHPHLLEIGWLRDKRPSLFERLEADPNYGMEVAPVARHLLSRQICIEVGPGLDEQDIQFTIQAIRRVLNHFVQLEK